MSALAALVLAVSIDRYPLPTPTPAPAPRPGLSAPWWLAPAGCRVADFGSRLIFAEGQEVGVVNRHLVGRPALFVAVNAAAAVGLSLVAREVGKKEPLGVKAGVVVMCGLSAYGTYTNMR